MTSLNVTDIVSFSLVAAKTPPEENEIKQKQLFSNTTFTIDISSQELRCKAQIHMQSLINVELFVTIPISVMIITMTKYINLIMHCTSINTFETFVHQDETHDVMIIEGRKHEKVETYC